MRKDVLSSWSAESLSRKKELSGSMERDSQEIRGCALVLSVMAFFIFIAAEIVQEEAADGKQRVVSALVALGVLGFAWIGPLTLLAGTMRFRTFKWWQPLEGGAEFIWMQAFGWCLHTLVLTAAFILLVNYDLPKWFEGQYLLLGVAGFFAQILLNLSIEFFQEADANSQVLQFPVNAKAIASLLISLSGTLLFVCFDILQSPALVAFGCAEFVASAVIIHVFYGCADIPGYRIWQPFEGEKLFLLLQYFGWQLFACAISGSLMICFGAGSSSSHRGTATAVGFMGLVSQIVLLISLQYFNATKVRDITNSGNVVATDQAQIVRRPREVYVSSLLCLGALGIGLLSHVSRSHGDYLNASFRESYMAQERIWWIINLVSLWIAVPIAHMGGVRSNPGYQWWQPFLGGTEFVFLQSIGWLWYGLFIALSIVLCLNIEMVGQYPALFVLVLGSASVGAISCSLSYFEASKTEPFKIETKQVKPSGSRNDQASTANGEIAIGVLLVLSCTCFHILVDIFLGRSNSPVTTMCLAIGVALFALGCAVIHVTGQKKHPRYRLWQPFEGGGQYVIRQAVGWTLFAVQLLFDSLLLSLNPEDLPEGTSTLVGIFALIPHFVLLSSLIYFEPPPIIHKKQYENTTYQLQQENEIGWSVLFECTSARWGAAVNVLVAISSMGLFICAEVLRQQTYFHRAEEVFFIFGCLGSVCGILLSHCVLGPKVHWSYKIFQPFQGGVRFVTLQGAAWTLISVAWVVSCTVFYWNATFFQITGIHILNGLLYFVAQALLLLSLPLFKPCTQPHQEPSSVTDENDEEFKQADMNYQLVAGPMLGIISCSVFVLVDVAILQFGPSMPMFPITICAVVALFSSIPLSYKLASSSIGAQAKEYSGSIVFVIVGCALWSFTILMGALYSYQLWTLEDPIAGVKISSPTGLMGAVTGSVGITAQLLLFQASDIPRSKLHHVDALHDFDWPLRIVEKLHNHLTSSCIWIYSCIALICSLLYVHVKTILPRHLPTNELWGLLLCSLVVVGSAWLTQQQIFASGSKCEEIDQLNFYSPCGDRKLQIYDLGLDCTVHIAVFLLVPEALSLSATCKAVYSGHSDAFWKRVFYAHQDCVTKTRSLQAYPDSDLAVGYGEIRSVSIITDAFANTLMNRVETILLNAICRLQYSVTIPRFAQRNIFRKNKWKAMCLGKERNFLVEQCNICKRVEIFCNSARRWEQDEDCELRAPSTWVTLCRCVNTMTLSTKKAHRQCLENYLRAPSLADCERTRIQTLHCFRCNEGPREQRRYPKNLFELIQASWKDLKNAGMDFGGGFFVAVPCSASVFISGLHWMGWTSIPAYALALMTTSLCFLVNTPRFERCLNLISEGESPQFVAYQRIYYVLTLTILDYVIGTWFLSNRDADEFSIFKLVIRTLWRASFSVYISTGFFMLFIYWRTQYRVPTVKGVTENDTGTIERHANLDPTAQPETGCVLCLLHLCTESTT